MWPHVRCAARGPGEQSRHGTGDHVVVETHENRATPCLPEHSRPSLPHWGNWAPRLMTSPQVMSLTCGVPDPGRRSPRCARAAVSGPRVAVRGRLGGADRGPLAHRNQRVDDGCPASCAGHPWLRCRSSYRSAAGAARRNRRPPAAACGRRCAGRGDQRVSAGQYASPAEPDTEKRLVRRVSAVDGKEVRGSRTATARQSSYWRRWTTTVWSWPSGRSLPRATGSPPSRRYCRG